MPTKTSNGTGGGAWSATATWAGGVCPVDDDTVVIASGDTVTYDVDWSSAVTYPNGINGMTITGTLKVSTSTSSYMKMKAATVIVGAGTFNIGESGAGAIPFAVKFTLTGGAGWYIDGNAGLTMTVYGAEPSIKTIKLSGDEAIGQTELSVDTDVRTDIWAVGDIIRIDDINKAKESEERVIAAGGIAESTITVTVGLTAAKSTGAVVSLITRNVKIIGEGTGTRTIYRVGSTANKLTIGGGMFYGVNKIMLDACHYMAISGGTFSGNDKVLNNCTSASVSGGTFSGNTYVLAYCTSTFVSGGTFSGNGYALNNCTSASVSGGTFSGNDNVLSGCTQASVSGGTFSGNTAALTYCIGMCVSRITFSTNTRNLTQCTGNLFNVTMSDGIEHFEYSFTKYNHNNCQWDNVAGVAGAFKAWCSGGIVTSQVSVLPSGYSLAYTHALASTTYPAFWYKTFTVAAGESVSVEVQLRKDASMTYLPRVYLMNSIENPIADPTQAEDSFTMTDSTDTWESDTFTIDNSAGTTDKDYTLWFVGMNASGNMYSAYDITTAGGGTSSVKIMPLGRVGL
jgi:hypothetical protein